MQAFLTDIMESANIATLEEAEMKPGSEGDGPRLQQAQE